MTRPLTDPLPTGLDDRARAAGNGRLAGLALMAGCVLATLGFLGVSLTMHGPEAAWPTDPLWQPMYGVALAGNLLVVLGLPAILAVHGSAARRLTLVGYVGIFAPLAMLNVAETTVEAFVKPYLATHGGFPEETPAGLNAFEAVALVLLIIGAVCFAIAVFRARILPIWVGVAVLLSVVCAFFLHGGAIVFVSDYVLFAALFWVGVRAARAE
ncbi:hypothetical protein [Petropleomorpha daqingensis]|uniref:DUF4386 family protein n=1 Tax=Petropleomorpha daqingensis TaxID=2026353 RepID=A0A853CDC7_9ACTN|nr:hypothetical protein [Petropleomorpha daqingensis]NYJ04153.1 hypothetical protein [Petropleomorpha daqingensis]